MGKVKGAVKPTITSVKVRFFYSAKLQNGDLVMMDSATEASVGEGEDYTIIREAMLQDNQDYVMDHLADFVGRE